MTRWRRVAAAFSGCCSIAPSGSLRTLPSLGASAAGGTRLTLPAPEGSRDSDRLDCSVATDRLPLRIKDTRCARRE